MKLCKLTTKNAKLELSREIAFYQNQLSLVRYLLRKESISEYIGIFLYSALNIQLNAAFLFASDAGFFGIILYMIAAFEDLTDNFQEIKQIE